MINQKFGDSSTLVEYPHGVIFLNHCCIWTNSKILASEIPISSCSKRNTACHYDFGSSPIRCHGSQTPTVRQRLETHYFVALKLCIYQGIWLATDSSRKHSPPDKRTFPSGKPKMLAQNIQRNAADKCRAR